MKKTKTIVLVFQEYFSEYIGSHLVYSIPIIIAYNALFEETVKGRIISSIIIFFLSLIPSLLMYSYLKDKFTKDINVEICRNLNYKVALSRFPEDKKKLDGLRCDYNLISYIRSENTIFEESITDLADKVCNHAGYHQEINHYKEATDTLLNKKPLY